MREVIQREELPFAVLHSGEKRQRVTEELARLFQVAGTPRDDSQIERGHPPFIRCAGRSTEIDGAAQRRARVTPLAALRGHDADPIPAARLSARVLQVLIQRQRASVAGFRFAEVSRIE